MNKAKEVHYDNDARERLMKGIDMVANAVKVTLGPKGRNVIIDRGYGAPHITKDGVTVAAEIVPEDAVEGMGARMVIEVAGNTVMAAGMEPVQHLSWLKRLPRKDSKWSLQV